MVITVEIKTELKPQFDLMYASDDIAKINKIVRHYRFKKIEESDFHDNEINMRHTRKGTVQLRLRKFN